jgi:hypothetical protein
MVRQLIKSRYRKQTPFWAENRPFRPQNGCPRRSKIMVFIYESSVRIENALFRFYPVLASIFGPQGLDSGTVLGENAQKWTMKPGSKTCHVFIHVFFDFRSIFASILDSFFVARAPLLAPKSHSGPHVGPVGIIF